MVDHPRLAFLYVVASLCYTTGRIEAAVRYSDAGQIVLGRSREAPPYGIEAMLGAVYVAIGQPEPGGGRVVPRPARHAAATPTSTSGHIWLPLFQWPVRVGRRWIPRMASSRLRRQQATRTCSRWRSLPTVRLSVTQIPSRRLTPSAGLVIAQDSGDRSRASILASGLARLEAEQGGTVCAFDHLTLAIRNYHDCGDTTTIRLPLAVLAVLFDRLGRYEPAATIAGFALSPIAAAGVPEITTAIAHLRDVLGEATYESLARKGETMTTAAMVTYAYEPLNRRGPNRTRTPRAETRRREPLRSRGGRPARVDSGHCVLLSDVAGCFLDELHAGGEAEFGVDVGEVGLHGAR